MRQYDFMPVRIKVVQKAALRVQAKHLTSVTCSLYYDIPHTGWRSSISPQSCAQCDWLNDTAYLGLLYQVTRMTHSMRILFTWLSYLAKYISTAIFKCMPMILALSLIYQTCAVLRTYVYVITSKQYAIIHVNGLVHIHDSWPFSSIILALSLQRLYGLHRRNGWRQNRCASRFHQKFLELNPTTKESILCACALSVGTFFCCRVYLKT